MLRQFINLCCLSPKVLLEQLEEEEKPRGNWLTTFTWKTARVSTTSGNTGNLSEFLIPGNILEFRWSSWKFLTAGTSIKACSHKQILLQSSCYDYVYFLCWLRLLGKQNHSSQELLWCNNCQLKYVKSLG